jgi:hypothetical protein
MWLLKCTFRAAIDPPERFPPHQRGLRHWQLWLWLWLWLWMWLWMPPGAYHRQHHLIFLLLLDPLLFHLSNQQLNYIPWHCRLRSPALGEGPSLDRCGARHSTGRPHEVWPCIPSRVRRTAACRSRKSLRDPWSGSTLRLRPQTWVWRSGDWNAAPYNRWHMRSRLGSAAGVT